MERERAWRFECGFVGIVALGVDRRQARLVRCSASRGEQFVPMRLAALCDADGWENAKKLALLSPVSDGDRMREVVPIPLCSGPDVELVEACMSDRPKPNNLINSMEALKWLNDGESLYNKLPWAKERKQTVTTGVLQDAVSGKVRKRSDILMSMMAAAPCKIVQFRLQEAESLSAGPVLSGFFVYRREMVKVLGQTIYSTMNDRLECRVGEIISMSAMTGSPVLLEGWAWEECAVRASVDPDTGRTVIEPGSSFAETSEPPGESDKDPSSLSRSEVLSMDVPSLRSALRSVGIPSKTSTPRSLLIDRLLPWLDETVRREIRIGEAVRKEDYGEAAALQADQSERSRVKFELDRAVEEERYLDAKALKDRLDRLTDMRADPTQDEGSYDPYLDQDEWYVPNR